LRVLVGAEKPRDISKTRAGSRRRRVRGQKANSMGLKKDKEKKGSCGSPDEEWKLFRRGNWWRRQSHDATSGNSVKPTKDG